jgi:predicted Zn finger-like uncharacterized protein
MSLRTSCPSCRANFLLPVTAAGRKVRCTQCGQNFVVSAAAEALPMLDEVEDADDRDGFRERPSPKSAAAHPRRREPEDDRPRRRSSRSRHRPRKDNVPLLIGLSLAGGVILMAAVVGLAYWATSDRDHPPPPMVAWNAVPPNQPAFPVNPQPPFVFNPAPPALPGGGIPGPPPAPFPNIPNPPPGWVVPPAMPKGPPIGVPNPPQQEEPEPPLPPFVDAPNPFRPGTQTRLHQLRTLQAPDAAAQIVYSSKHDLLFVRNKDKGLWVMDVKAGDLGKQSAVDAFTDLSLAPDQSAFYAADYGGTNIGYATPRRPSHVHRYDLAARKWERRQAPKIAYRVEVVDPWRFLLLEQDQWVAASLNRWEKRQDRVTELSRAGAHFAGDMEYDPRTGRIYHGNSGISSPEIHVLRVAGDKLKVVGDTGGYGTASKAGGGSAVLSSGGRRFYYGKLQVEAMNVKNNQHTFPEVILAASRDLAFGEKGYYDAQTGAKVGEWGFNTRVVNVSPDGMSLWVYNPTTNELHQYAIEGTK